MPELEEGKRVELQVEAWKTIVEVQQHFNDIELKIRGLALTVITAVLGAVALALKDGTTILLLGVRWKLATLVIAAGIVIWRGFYQVDQIWYHRLLLGAVKQGIDLEARLKDQVPGIELAKRIGDESPYEVERVGRALGARLRKKWPERMSWTQRSLHSTDKLRRFYRTVLVLLVVMGLVVQLGKVNSTPRAPSNAATTNSTVTATSTSTTASSTTTTAVPGGAPSTTR